MIKVRQTGAPSSSPSGGTPPVNTGLLVVSMFFFGFLFFVLELVSLATLTFGFTNWMSANEEGSTKNFALLLYAIAFVFQVGAFLVGRGIFRRFQTLRRGGYSDVG